MPHIFTNLIGYIAAVVGTFLMLPQIIKSYKSKKTADLSIGMVVIYIINCCLWLIYGLLLSALPIILANGIGLAIGIAQLFLKIKYNN
ncbi:MAG: SemiSWEET family transporter [bacterium]|nr:SemiSWEET family transporter [bacterium]